jgi:hypothetical protein
MSAPSMLNETVFLHLAFVIEKAFKNAIFCKGFFQK